MRAKLTPKQEAFAAAYVETGNAAEAYRRVYNAAKMSPESIYVAASRLLDNAKVALRVEELQAEAAERNNISVDRVIQEYARIAFGNLSDVAPWDESGPRLIPSDELAEDQLAMVESIRVKRRREVSGRGEDAEAWEVEEVQIKRHDKLAALQALGKHLGLFVELSRGMTPAEVVEDVRRRAEGMGMSREQVEAAVKAAEEMVA